MAEVSQEEIFQSVLRRFLSKSHEEMRAIDEDDRYDHGVFTFFQEISDIIESGNGYQEFIQHNDDMKIDLDIEYNIINDEKININISIDTINVIEPNEYSFPNKNCLNEYLSGNGGMPCAA